MMTIEGYILVIVKVVCVCVRGRESERNRDTVRYRKWCSYLVKLVSCCGFLLLLLVSDKFNHIFTRFDFVATTRKTKY